MKLSRIASIVAIVTIISSAAYGVQPTPRPQEVFAPYWTSEPGWTTELQLRNNLTSGSLTVTPVLRVASGQEIPFDPVAIPSNASVSVWVNEQLLSHASQLLGQPGSYGSVVFRFISPNAENLFATAVPSMNAEPIAFPVGAHRAWAAQDPLRRNRAGSLEGMWWIPRSGLTDILVISNSSDKNITSTLSLFDSGGKRWSQTLSFRPYQTRRIALDQLVHKAGLSGAYGGIKIEVPAYASALDGLHFMYEETGKASVRLEMFHRDPTVTLRERTGDDSRLWTMRAPMLALRTPDPVLGLPAKVTLQPTIFLHNTTANQVAASISLAWRGESGKAKVDLSKLNLPPFATEKVDIGAMQKQLGVPDDAHWALVTLTSTGMPDDLIAAASSYDSTLRYNLESRFQGGLGGHFVDGRWRADATHNQIVAITNGGTRPTDALLTLHYENGAKRYELQQRIQSGEQMWVNLADLIHNRVVDRHGNPLPADLTTGTFDVRDLTPGGHGLTESSLAIESTLGFQAVPPPCPECCGYDLGSIVFDPTFVDVVVDGIDSLSVDAVTLCGDQVTDISTAFGTWGSDDTSIASVTTRQAKGVAPGLTTGFAEGVVEGPGQCGCNFTLEHTTLPLTVTPRVALQGNGYVYIGHDGQVTQHINAFFGTGIPSGGTYRWSSTDSSVSFDNAAAATVHVTATSYSGRTNDTPVTVTYTDNSQSASAVVNVTKRVFYYLAGDSVIKLTTYNGPTQYGYDYQLSYNVFTHPDRKQVTDGNGVSTSESVTIVSHNVPFVPHYGQGGLNANSQLVDLPSLISTAPLPVNLSIIDSQDLGVGGFFVRNNTLTYASSGLTETSNGPSN